MPKLIMAYFAQRTQYFSESAETFRLIVGMDPRHAANAAEKLLREAGFWVKEAGVDTLHPALWVVTRPLFQALSNRANY